MYHMSLCVYEHTYAMALEDFLLPLCFLIYLLQFLYHTETHLLQKKFEKRIKPRGFIFI